MRSGAKHATLCSFPIRFSGEVFPPFIVFKIFTSMSSRERDGERNRERDGEKRPASEGEEPRRDKPGAGTSADSAETSTAKRSGIKYISGRRMIRPSSKVSFGTTSSRNLPKQYPQ